MDFFQVAVKQPRKNGPLVAFPDFTVRKSKDLMVRGKAFYAIWNEPVGLWSTDEYDVVRLVDRELEEAAEAAEIDTIMKLENFENGGWTKFQKYLKNISDNYHALDGKLTFANTEVKKTDYVSRRLPYDLAPGDISAWNELIGTLYAPEEKAKIEWAIGAVVSGDSTEIEKFIVLFGPPGKGKGTVLNIILKLFPGYIKTFDAKALVSNGNAFATEAFKGNPLVAIQHDGDLSRIEDNTRLNSIVGHEIMTINEKYKPTYDDRIKAFLFMGTNSPVKVTDGKSGMLRRLIDVKPTEQTVSPLKYHTLMGRINFELGAIAHHCLETYKEMGRNYYSGYVAMEMLYQTNIFFNFIEANFDIFEKQDGTSLKQAYALYKEFCSDTGIDKPLPQYRVRAQLQDYFKEFHDRYQETEGTWVRSYFKGFKAVPYKAPVKDDPNVFSLILDETRSLLDLELADCPAQGHRVNDDGAEVPLRRWMDVKTRLAEIDTSDVHYVKVPENHIVIDFDIKVDGEKSLDENLKAASIWPPTYAEVSKGGNGIHLHYIYEGDVSELASQYSEGIEIKTLLGNSSLRRRLSRCNDVPVATLRGGLPLKEKKVLSTEVIKSEKGLRDLIERNLRKEIHPGTKPSIDFILKILEDAYKSGMPYDVSDMQSRLYAFANNSNNQAVICLKTVQKMPFKSEDNIEDPEPEAPKDDRLVFFDIEVYPNLFVVCWKYAGSDVIVKMINPSPAEVGELFKLKLVGFNNRRYDNHIMWARFMGYDLDALYKLSQKIISGSVGALFGEAYKLSYTDIYDFSSKKQSLKRFGIDLGLTHLELDIPWDQPVPEELWLKVVEYCCNDVTLTEATFEHRMADFVARQILAELSGLTVNDTTQRHTAKIVFNGTRNPQADFIYTDLSKEFPGYTYSYGKSSYREEDPSEGGYVYAEPGMYENVAVLDVESMHPTSIIQLDAFGMHTKNFADLVNARLAIKHGDLETARTMLGGKMAPFLEDESNVEGLSDALKIAINIVYGLTSAKFDNPFRDPRNKDNIVAKRGALFMIELKHYVQEMGYQVVHIKTDSIKIPNATDEVIEEIQKFGEKYGYKFKHENTYDKFCLVNDAVYIAREDTPMLDGVELKWTAVGAQFQHAYVFKTLFGGSGDNTVLFDDLCETKQVVQGAMYLDLSKDASKGVNDPETMHFIGRTGRFVPVQENYGGGTLWRVKDGKHYAVTGTKGYLWVEAAQASELGGYAIDMDYFERLATEAKETIRKFGDFEKFVAE